MVNRLWQQHFGRGIVGTPSDFGAMGDRPTHPELLDWLATEFMAPGMPASSHGADQLSVSGAWSLKKMQRLMVTSATYRQSAAYNPQASRIDPENHLLWHYARRRLEGEAIRDAMLAVSGALNPKMGGPSVFPPLPAGITTRGNWQDTKDPQERNRRSIYVFVKRNLRYPLFAAFDMPDTHGVLRTPPRDNDGAAGAVSPQRRLRASERAGIRCTAPARGRNEPGGAGPPGLSPGILASAR